MRPDSAPSDARPISDSIGLSEPLTSADAAGQSRPAPLAAGATALGAAPSNTAPQKYPAVVPGVRRVLRVAIDSLYVSFKGSLGPATRARLKDLKELAQGKEPKRRSLAQLEVGGRVFSVLGHGRGRVPFALDHPDFSLSVGSGEGYPLASVQISSEFLASVGPLNALEDVRHVVRSLAPIQDREAVSRVDLCVDFTPDRPFQLFPPQMWVTRAERINPYLKRGELTGWSIGQGGDLSARLYDKITEIFDKSHKAHWFELWRGQGWDAGDDVWRLEFQFRRPVLLELGTPTLLDVLEKQAGLWAYAMDWLSLRLPTADSNRSRWPVASTWATLAGVDWGSPPLVLKRQRLQGVGTFDRQSRQLLGLLTSYMGARGMTDLDQGIGAFLDEFEELAESIGTTAAAFVEARARLKGARFSRINNRRELGVDRAGVRQSAQDYRQARDGEV